MTKYGFYSIVQKEPGVYHIRSRERKDIENLVENVPLPEAEIMESNLTDYAVRVIVEKENVLAVLKFLGENLDYDNFKAKIDRTSNQRHKPYHEVWQVLAYTLGAYGRKPGEKIHSI